MERNAFAFDKDSLVDMINVFDGGKKLFALSDRGIILNEWQANMLLLNGRGFGKTYLSYVKVCEYMKDAPVSIPLFDISPDAMLQYDYEENPSCQMKLDWLAGLDKFINKYYKDALEVTFREPDRLVVMRHHGTPITPIHWWVKD